jgi:hypothetical protein
MLLERVAFFFVQKEKEKSLIAAVVLLINEN